MIDLAFAKALAGKQEEKEVLLFLAELMKTSREGNLYLSHPTIGEKIVHLTTGEMSPLVAFGDCYYLRRSWELETEVIHHLKRLSLSPKGPLVQVPENPLLYPSQQTALHSALTEPLTIITGGPGCGKTFLATKIFETLLRGKPEARIIATAPTGKAAGRLKMPSVISGTLHSLLGLRDSFDEGRKPKPLIADLILIDECSMIDLRLWSLLLSMIPTGTRLVLMGDPDQLPPIDAGALFHDICQITKIPHIHLDQIKRTESKGLQRLAEHIKGGDCKAALQEIALQPLDKIPTPSEDEIILTPFRHGPFGTLACNQEIESRAPHRRKPIIITKNDYPLGLMNGDLGYIEDGKAYFPDKTYPLPLLTAYDYAWAISIHKSQGSEFRNVHILLPSGSEILGRELLYTAATRARSNVFIYSILDVFKKIISQRNYPRSNVIIRF